MHMTYSQREAQMTTPKSKQSVEQATGKQSDARPTPSAEIGTGVAAWIFSTVGTLVVLGAIGLYVVTEQQVVQDAAFTPLYDFTLKQAYSRFQESEKRVALNAPSDPIEAMASPQAAAQGMPQNRAAQQQAAQQRAAQQRAAQQRAAATAMDDGGPHTKRGNELLQTAQYDQAIAAFNLALAENPQRITTRHSLGDALRYAQRHDEAIVVYREVLRQNPQYYCCYTHIGDIEKARNNLQAAQTAYAQAERGYTQQLEQGGPMASAAKYQLATLYLAQDKNLAQALVFAQEMVAAQPDQAAYQQLLAQVYVKLGRRAEAIAIFETLANSASNPQHATYYKQQITNLQQSSGMAGPPAPRQE